MRPPSVLGLHRPWTIALPVLTPRLSSLWVRFVTRARWSVAREVVVGLTHDLLAHDDRFWSLIGHQRRLHFAEAARSALAAEAAELPSSGAWAVVERAPGCPARCLLGRPDRRGHLQLDPVPRVPQPRLHRPAPEPSLTAPSRPRRR